MRKVNSTAKWVILSTCLLMAAPLHARSITSPPPADDPSAIVPSLSEETSLSTLEKFYAKTAEQDLVQFGYDIFQSSSTDKSAPTGIINDNYPLSAGDELLITLRGQKSTSTTHTINSSGQLIIEDLAPITVTNLTLGQLKAKLAAQIQKWHNTQIYVSLTKHRQISVILLGHIKQPGQQKLSAGHSLLDALIQAGGIEKTGTLRNIRILRGGQTINIDLYDILHGTDKSSDIPLRSGDRIIAPSIGETIAITGDTKRPAIYEIKNSITASSALSYSGGYLSQGKNRLVKISGGSTHNINNARNTKLDNGDRLHIARAEDKISETITLEGHSTQTGKHAYSKDMKLSKLLKGTSLYKDNIYPLIATITRTNPTTLLKRYISFSPAQLSAQNFDLTLKENDKITLFSQDEIAHIYISDAQADKTEQKTELPVALINFIKEHNVSINGAIRKRHHLPVAENTKLSDIIAASGGTSRDANLNRVEITSSALTPTNNTLRETISLHTNNAKDIFLKPGDSIRIHKNIKKLTHEKVMLLGEVISPGEYDLLPGDTYASLIDRAGGLTQQAYPGGTIFSRASERKREEKRFRNKARDLELRLASLLDTKDDKKKPDMGQVALVENLISQLNNAEALGRITIQAQPGILKADPNQDILLEKGDKIYIPKRPMTIRVIGEVLSPAALQFRDDKDVNDYIQEAGGTTYYADSSRTFAIHPDGSAQPVNVGAWVHNPVKLPPGSTLMVPKDPKPFDFMETAKDISQILTNLAITGIYLDEIGDD